MHHVAFWVDDIEALQERVASAGYKAGPISTGDTVAYGEPPGREVKTVFFRDPDGIWVQLDQRV